MKDSVTNHLLKIVVAARELRVNSSFIDGWKRIFGEADSLEIHRKIGLLYNLIDAAAQEILVADPDQAEAVNHWKTQLYSGLSATATRSWMEFHEYIDNHTVNYLRTQATLVHLTNGDSKVNYEELLSAKSLLIEAIEEIASSSLSSQTKIKIIRRVRMLIAAIEDYSLTGNDAVFDQFKSAIFDIATNQEIHEKGLGEKFAKATEMLANILTSATGIQQLAGPALKFLGLGK